ncbi:unnamed protein product [Cylindrotheca closterium]|uniref:Sialate O-acetylesterase domain-containing protein n=1 Tax=Cylindrotheca closterium TaxID=2856 RepID=A0AAD2JI11_9STRA|nr:unnamed protein product [Cylindrotheca closterium]
MMSRTFRILAAFTCLFQPSLAQGNECVDDDTQIALMGAQQGRNDMTACIDVMEGCNIQNHLGDSLREICCKTCSDYDPNKPAVATQLPSPGETVQVYLLAGQSECTGQAGVGELTADPQRYPELQGEISGVWFAGYASPAAVDRFFIAPMKAGRDRTLFGPEISFGERMHAVTGRPTMVMKYCSGGTNTHSHWNPFNRRNMWDTSADDGTAQWMATNGGLDFATKKTQFKNMVYTIRRTQEALLNAGILFNWAGIVWVQGQADLKGGDPVWKLFGEGTARVWDGFRREVGRDVPIIDTGSNTHNQLQSGKEYATQLVKGCKAKNVEFALASNDDTASDCVVSASTPCFDSPNLHLNAGPLLFYGYDPLFPAGERKCEDRSTCKEFEWYRKYPTNIHSGYEGMILKGRMLANAFVSEFTDYTLPSSYLHSDPAALYPWKPCATGTLPSEGNYCWIDYRDESMMIKPSSELCSYSQNIVIDDSNGPYGDQNNGITDDSGKGDGSTNNGNNDNIFDQDFIEDDDFDDDFDDDLDDDFYYGIGGMEDTSAGNGRGRGLLVVLGTVMFFLLQPFTL